jgi:hypothetical protein
MIMQATRRAATGRYIAAAIALGVVLATAGPQAVAQGERHAGPGARAPREVHSRAPQWHGDIARFHEHDWGIWRGGHWSHGRHDGRLGWWWIVGGAWYFYPWPVYPYPNPWEPPVAVPVPAPVTVAPPPPTPYWYYCDSSRAYYPYVSTCAEGWKQVPATPADAVPVPSR